MILKKITVIFIIFFINFWFINVANSENNTFFISIDLVLEKTLLGKKIIKELDDIEKKNQKILTEIKSKITESENNLNSSKNIISKEDYNLKLVQLKNDIDIFNEKKNDLIKSFDAQRKKKIDEFFLKINPLIENYMVINSIDILIEKRNIFIAKRDYDITKYIIDIIDNEFK